MPKHLHESVFFSENLWDLMQFRDSIRKANRKTTRGKRIPFSLNRREMPMLSKGRRGICGSPWTSVGARWSGEWPPAAKIMKFLLPLSSSSPLPLFLRLRFHVETWEIDQDFAVNILMDLYSIAPRRFFKCWHYRRLGYILCKKNDSIVNRFKCKN